MKPALLAASTILAWMYGIALVIVGFTDSRVEQFANRVYPIIAILLAAGVVAYVADALRNPRVPAGKRGLWAAILILAHWFAQPFYWWWYLRPRRA